MPSHDDEDLSEGHDIDVKEYFKNLFKNRSTLWQELKHLISPDDDFKRLSRTGTHVTAHIVKKEAEVEEDTVDFDEIDPDVEAPTIRQSLFKSASKEASEQAREIRQILYNRALPLSYIKDFQQETRKVVVRPPKKKEVPEVALLAASSDEPTQADPTAAVTDPAAAALTTSATSEADTHDASHADDEHDEHIAAHDETAEPATPALVNKPVSTSDPQ